MSPTLLSGWRKKMWRFTRYIDLLIISSTEKYQFAVLFGIIALRIIDALAPNKCKLSHENNCEKKWTRDWISTFLSLTLSAFSGAGEQLIHSISKLISHPKINNSSRRSAVVVAFSLLSCTQPNTKSRISFIYSSRRKSFSFSLFRFRFVLLFTIKWWGMCCNCSCSVSVFIFFLL